MIWRNTEQAYGWVAILLHWVVAAVVVGMFALGLWMVDLTYYDSWYRQAPDLHKSVGVLLAVLLVLRLGWRASNTNPQPEQSHSKLEKRIAGFVHRLLYALLFAVVLTGYLISTADGRPIDVFGWFRVPATVSGLPNQADIAGTVHFYLAWSLVGIAALHGAAALKHHFVDRDRTLKRMLGP